MMIINFPTGLYKSALGTEDNVTWYISSNDPPRSARPFVQLPVAEKLRSAPDKQYTEQERRASVGALAFSVVESTQDDVASSKKQFEVGQVLDFITEEVPTITLPGDSELAIRHDTNVLDLESLGLSETEIASLCQRASETKDSLDASFDDARTRVADLEVLITENQKKINEIEKTIDAIVLIGDQIIVERLQLEKQTLIEGRALLVQEHEQQVTLAGQLRDQIRQVSQMVR